ncbi:T9SS type A sorting domain-containing protein [Aureivirga sp. CE67]|uniref:T9SS type A sorting domain-containing protein n=1 Tax=Aureivirga sp. CE67 TaxID=1788983 RepID=UPI0018CA27E6|nr:T9SS type A sorting domain-containing protein [Aureivirga sp. CE67]
MKKQLLFAMMLMVSFFGFSQYKPLLEEGKVWVYCIKDVDQVPPADDFDGPIYNHYGECFKVYADGVEELDGVEYRKIYMELFYQESVTVDYNQTDEEVEEALAQLPVTYEDLAYSEVIEIMENAEDPVLIGYMREDTTEKKVFSKVFIKDEDDAVVLSEENMIYDFSLNEQDVFEYKSYCQDGELSVDMSELIGITEENIKLIDKSTVEINGEELIHFNEFRTEEGNKEFLNSKNLDIEIIESIGSDNNLMHPFSFDFSFVRLNTQENGFERCNFGKLMFVSKDDEVIYNPSEFDYNNLILSTEDVQLELESIEVSPIPASDYVQVKAFQQNLSFELFDINGRKLKVFSENSNSDYSLNISHLEKGVYFLKITNDDNTSITKKIMKQ